MSGIIGGLKIITPQFLLILSALALLTLGSALYLARKHHRASAVVVGLLAFVLLPASAADAFNAHYQYLPRLADVVNTPTWPTARASVVLHFAPNTLTPDALTPNDLTPYATPPRRSAPSARTGQATTVHPAAPHTPPYAQGVVVQLPLPGRVSGFGTHLAYVYLPPQYFTEPTRRFPVLYLIHGSPGGPIDWFRSARAAEAGEQAAQRGTPTIIVAPRASRSWTDDSECVNQPREQVETYLTVDVPAAVDAVLRTTASRAGRAIGGNSAGGFCALNLGLRHRDVFRAIVDLSGFDHPTYDGGMVALFGRRADLAAVVAANDPSQYVSRLPLGPRVSVWLDTGRSDAQPRHDAERMLALLTYAGQDVQLHERRGGHEYGVWRPALGESLLWVAQLMSTATA